MLPNDEERGPQTSYVPRPCVRMDICPPTVRMDEGCPPAVRMGTIGQTSLRVDKSASDGVRVDNRSPTVRMDRQCLPVVRMNII
jgi:hypothetical protein